MIVFQSPFQEGSQYAQNQVFEEYCIYEMHRALPLYVLTFA
jgi:hypothetical protein